MLTPALRFWLLLSLCLLGFGLLYAVVHDAGCGARRRAVQRRIAALGAPLDAADEVAVESLRDAMAQAQQALRRTASVASTKRAAKRAAPVPWFLCFGDAAANLPGLLATARGQRVPPAEPVVSVPFTDTWWHWWLTGATVAIELHPAAVGDTAGTPPVRALWLQSLLALAVRRDRFPLNGLVVGVAANELLQADGTELKALAARMRHLLDETGDTLRLQLPTYLVVTGLERLDGYATVRRALPPEVLSQVLGHRLTNPSAFIETPAGERFDAVFEPLAQHLHALRAALLRTQHEATGRLAVHEFVEALRALQPGLRQFAQVLFEPHGKGVRAPRWRGLYLTANASPVGDGAFVNDLFERFLPADQPLVRPGRPSSNTGHASRAESLEHTSTTMMGTL
ncbi:type VI secretion system protein [Variovorax sp. J22G73]|uniref:type VI secretion system protein n=1 Tax=unclassified Variovorax TaxID=663243 RepID=UPI002577CB27|nr:MULTISPECIES: type VI secretion system protein [unclassified Variovorax]MDM0009344.1 type VI secretion system protein [Variovorax sp. J22R203]MDM0101720.1 type VI secretion system protein [Variovorax sp. J22G73]